MACSQTVKLFLSVFQQTDQLCSSGHDRLPRDQPRRQVVPLQEARKPHPRHQLGTSKKDFNNNKVKDDDKNDFKLVTTIFKKTNCYLICR